MEIRLAIAGATGLVGQELLRIMEAAGESPQELGLFASQASDGRVQRWFGRDCTVHALDDCDFGRYNAAFFCVGDELSARYVPLALSAGCAVVDKSNAFRLDPAVPLVVGGINDRAVLPGSRLVANPNCSTIILLHAVAPLAKRFGITRLWVATYQSVSGAGGPGVEKLERELEEAGSPADMLKRPELAAGSFAYNVVPSIGSLDRFGRCSEETKLVEESRKILETPGLSLIAHAARVPVVAGHSMAVTVELGRSTTAGRIVETWEHAPDVRCLAEGYPTPLSASRHDQVEVGRLRKEQYLDNAWSFFVSGDNLRLGAALNGWRLMQLLGRAGSIETSKESPGGSHA